jgi:transcriptional regulator with XRE-family HTH domain
MYMRSVDYVEVGLRIKSARKHSGLKQKDLARLLGVTQASICRWECGHNGPHPLCRTAVAEALGLTVDELFPFVAAA